MHFSTIQAALRETEQLEQGREEAAVPTDAPDAAIITDPEIKELIRYLGDNPLFKHQLLIYFYRCKQGGQKTEETGTSPFE